MSDSEKLKTFDEKRDEFKPYGLTCEIWRPQLMPKIDRHNEIELNYITRRGYYLFLPYRKSDGSTSQNYAVLGAYTPQDH